MSRFCHLSVLAVLYIVVQGLWVVVEPSAAAETGTPTANIGAFQLPSECVNDEVRLSFSTDGRSVCAWWWPHQKSGDYEKNPVDFLVVDTSGRLLGNSHTTNRNELLRENPSIAWREMRQDFVTNSVGWGFYGAPPSKGLRIQSTGDVWGPYVAEMWALSDPQKLLWKTDMPPLAVKPRVISLLNREEGGPVLIAITGQQIIEVDNRTGQIRRGFTPGPIESDQEAVKRKKRFRLSVADTDPSLKFGSFALSHDTAHGLLACGAFFDKRVRVIRVSSPDRIHFEANTDVHPALPKGGQWGVRRVEFLAGGKYLLAEYHFGGRGTSVVSEPTEIFETATWRVVWREDDLDTRAVTLSSDGMLLALLRTNTLEVRRFEPNVKEGNKLAPNESN
ncbi:MAG: hypothetical protein WCS94_16860 [Verrucomicrobiota bacterium]